MNKIKEQALNKLLEEVNRSNNDAIDKIHNWISDQNDTELFTGILQKGKNLAEALSYCASKVKRSGNYGIATDEAVFSWVKEYFMLSSTNVSKENFIVKTNTKQKVDNDEKRIAYIERSSRSNKEDEKTTILYLENKDDDINQFIRDVERLGIENNVSLHILQGDKLRRVIASIISDVRYNDIYPENTAQALEMED